MLPNAKKQIGGNYSSPATEDTGIQPEKFTTNIEEVVGLESIGKKQIAGNYSSPATEDTGIQPEKFTTNKRVQGVINKIIYYQGTK